MGPENTQHDDAIDRTLGVLRDAAPPAGMETRIVQRLAEQRVNTTEDASLGRDLFARLTPQSQWLRGAFCGAAAASLACAILFFATRPAHTPLQNGSAAQAGGGPSQHGAAPQTVRTTPVSVRAEVPAGQSGNAPCGNPALIRAHNNSAAPRVYPSEDRPILRSASFAPSKPAPPTPLTAQERALIQLVRTASPAAVAALSPAAEQKADAEREAAFEKFFAPSPQLIAAEKAEEEAAHSADGTSPQPTQVQN